MLLGHAGLFNEPETVVIVRELGPDSRSRLPFCPPFVSFKNVSEWVVFIFLDFTSCARLEVIRDGLP